MIKKNEDSEILIADNLTDITQLKEKYGLWNCKVNTLCYISNRSKIYMLDKAGNWLSVE